MHSPNRASGREVVACDLTPPLYVPAPWSCVTHGQEIAPASDKLQLELEASRGKLLKALAGATDITLIRSFGNIGDQLIYAGTRRLLANIDYREVSLLQLEGVRGQLAVITGGGAWCQPHSHMAQYLRRIEEQFERVVILPSSFDVAEASVRQALTMTKALVFARERVSYEQIRDLCQAALAHDTAFFFDYRPYECTGRGLLTAYRTDREATGLPIPPDNNDISVSCESLDEWLWTIARHELVETDRAHVMIAAALLGKRVYYRASSYHKVPAIAAFALGDRAVTLLGPSRAEMVKEQMLRHARALERQLPADFVAAHQQLAVTIVMLSHGRLEQTRLAIRALQAHVRIPFKLLLVDNGSGREVQRELTAISAADQRIELILLDENLGCAGGRHFALARVTTPYALLIDNDVEALPGAVEHLLHYIEQHPQATAVMGRIVFPDGTLHLCGGEYRVENEQLLYDLLGNGRRFDEALGASGPCRWVAGTLTILRPDRFARQAYDLGLRHYYEDLEWCYRLNQTGAGEFHRCLEALAIHHHEAKVPDASLPLAEQRRQAMKYVETIAHFYRQHAVIVQNLFDFVPELRTADGQSDIAAARLLLALVNAYGSDWVLERWQAGHLAPLFMGVARDCAASAAPKDELGDELGAQTNELPMLKAALVRRQREIEQMWAQIVRQDQAQKEILSSNAWQVVELYWRIRRALRRWF